MWRSHTTLWGKAQLHSPRLRWIPVVVDHRPGLSSSAALPLAHCDRLAMKSPCLNATMPTSYILLRMLLRECLTPLYAAAPDRPAWVWTRSRVFNTDGHSSLIAFHVGEINV
jgi:hypothetical protein